MSSIINDNVRVLPQNPDVVINPALSDLAQPQRALPPKAPKEIYSR